VGGTGATQNISMQIWHSSPLSQVALRGRRQQGKILCCSLMGFIGWMKH